MSPSARFVVFLSVVLGVWLLEHLYVGWRLLSLPILSAALTRRLLLGLLVFGFVSYPAGQLMERGGLGWPAHVLHYAGAVWMGALFLLLFAFIAADLITLAGAALEPWVGTIRTAAAGLAVAAAAAAWIGGTVGPRTLDVEAVLDGLPAEHDGLVLVQVSDVHLGTMVGARRLRRLVDRVHSLQPDMVAVTGDLVDGRDHDSMQRLLPEMRRLRAPLGVFAVLGNHEFYAGAELSREVLREAGYTVLDNASVEVVPGLVVAGVPDHRGALQTGQPGADLDAAIAEAPAGAAVVLLHHSPEGETAAAAAGVDLMLCGHTHGGQIWPFHHLVRLAYPHLAGVYRVGSMTQVVSRGAGRWGPPMRLFAPSDIVRVTFRSRQRR